MCVQKFKTIFTLIIVFLLSQIVWSQTSKISGKITDKTTNEPLLGTNVFLVGTSLGAASNAEGDYLIPNVIAGSYTLKVSYVGYKTVTVNIELKKGQQLIENFKLEPVGVEGKTVVVTAQASGQNAAINQQLSSNKIVNVVSAARIKELPDQNAAESVGRLPGVYLLRQGGQGYEVSINGLQPKYNRVEIDGVEMAATSSSDRAVNMSMISSNMLSGIEVFKTVTPDMNAAVLGGIVNFQIREAKKTSSGAPEIQLSAQGGYEGLRSQFGDYNFSATVGKRFLNQRLGILVQAVVDRQNLSSDELGASYQQKSKNPGVLNPLYLTSLNLSFIPSITRRYNGTINMDYKLSGGKIDFMNFFSGSNTTTQTLSQQYSIASNQIFENASYSPAKLYVMTNLLDLKENLLSFDVDAKVSHSLSENISRGGWGATFQQYPANLNTVPNTAPPVTIAQASLAKVDPNLMNLLSLSKSNNITMQRNIVGSIDITRDITLSNAVSGILKFGGQYHYSHRSYSAYNEGGGGVFSLTLPRRAIINAYPFMTQPPYNLSTTGNQLLPITVFEDPGFKFGNFLKGSYAPPLPMNLDLLSQIVNLIHQGAENADWQKWGYTPDPYGLIANNYSGNEYESAAYAMATINIGTQITLIAGARYQGLATSYRTARIFDANLQSVNYPTTYKHRDTTIDQYHGYLLPDVSLTYKPLSWLTARLSYTNTLSYPDFTSIIPKIDIFSSSNAVTWNNFALKPAHSQNYNVQLSFYNNAIGLFTVGGFLKRIDDMIFTQNTYVADSVASNEYPGIPPPKPGSLPKVYNVTTEINNPYRVDDYGVELDWQTHFWYLPGLLSGLVFNINYTHIFSSAKYFYNITKPGVFPTFIPVHIDTFYTDRLLYQPDNVVNLSAGYDYKGFSVVVSMIYQSNVSTGTDQYPEMRPSKNSYLRWDLTAKQNLPWPGLVVYLNMVNLNHANDTYVVRGNGFPTSESDYGPVVQLGLRWSLQ
ncbi:MAG TPA: TonB-dependent receptor [Ignavibacteriaceae bacterium]|nr:TonB-dependent receptor [Ignavibacteriaceae bacterium]